MRPNFSIGDGFIQTWSCRLERTLLTQRKLMAIAQFGMVLVPVLMGIPDRGMAQLSPHTPVEIAQNTSRNTRQLFVNPRSGNDGNSDGSQTNPFKTLTHALQQAQPNTVIQLAPGIYSPQSGEQFPLRLKRGVTIQGNGDLKGQSILIQGGGTFRTSKFGNRNVAMIGEDGATLQGVTVTNPNGRGYGLWIESGRPSILNNTFTGNAQDGVLIAGDSTALLQGNVFWRNQGNGVSIYENARPELSSNSINETGFGVLVSQRSAPRLTGNHISRNREGVLVDGSAQPVFRENVIFANQQDGLVAIAQSIPDLGTQSDPGKNMFYDNGRYDIHITPPRSRVTAYGNQVEPSRTLGLLAFQGQDGAAINGGADLGSVEVGEPSRESSREASNQTSAPISPSVFSGQQPRTGVGGVAGTGSRTTTGSIPIPVPPPESSDVVSPAPRRPTPVVTAPTPRTSPPPSSQPRPNPSANSTGLNLPVLEPSRPGDLLPVPDSDIPSSNVGDRTSVIAPGNGDSLPPPPFSDNPTNESFLPSPATPRFRVLVLAPTEFEQELVKSLVPGSFRTVANGQMVMQAGIFQTQNNAEELAQELQRNGLRTQVRQD